MRFVNSLLDSPLIAKWLKYTCTNPRINIGAGFYSPVLIISFWLAVHPPASSWGQ
jgi:hypothetical protein